MLLDAGNGALAWVGVLVGCDGCSPVLGQREMVIAEQIVKEILSRLRFLMDVGLDYLSLDRAAATLSGGESQRIRLATQIGSDSWGYCIFAMSRRWDCTRLMTTG